MIDTIGFFRGVTVGDIIKSWDVLKTANFIRDHLSRKPPCWISEPTPRRSSPYSIE